MSMGVIITGGTSRLGRALTSNLSAQGHVIYTYFSSPPCLESSSTDYVCQAHRLDLSQLSAQSALEFMHQCVTHIDVNHWVLINNSSVFDYDFPGEANFEMLETALKVNCVAPLMLIEALLKSRTHQRVTVVNILDAKLQALNPDYFSYTLSKQALKTSIELYVGSHHERARFYGVAPAMFAESGPATVGRVQELITHNPLHYPLSADDIVHAVELAIQGHLANGSIIYADAGQHLMQLPRDVAYLTKDHFNANHVS